MDLFVVPTISFRLLYGLLIMGHGRWQILWVGATAHTTAEWIANQLTEASGWEQIPRYLMRDRDEPMVRFLSAAFDRSALGSIRRGCIDHIVIFGERHLRHVLLSYMDYCNGTRPHLSLSKDAPMSHAAETAGRIIRRPILGRTASSIWPDLIKGRHGRESPAHIAAYQQALCIDRTCARI
jgi:hypothetical protein